MAGRGERTTRYVMLICPVGRQEAMCVRDGRLPVPKHKVYLASVFGQFLPVVWLGILGASLATKSGTADPGHLIVDNFGVLAIPVLFLVLHGPIATNILNIYTFSVAAQALDIKAKP